MRIASRISIAAVCWISACCFLTNTSVAGGPTPALSKLTKQYHFELIAAACVRHGLLDPKVVIAMQQAEARYQRMLPPGADVEGAKARVAESTRAVADSIDAGAGLFCRGLAGQIY
jgi:hypothetical protein